MIFNDILSAHERIKPYIYNTPIIRLQQLDDYLGCKVYIKAENIQITNSFKIRGALNKFLYSKEKLTNGVVATSSGSHGIAVAYSAKLFNIPATIILRDTSPLCKRNMIQSLGAQVIVLPYNLRYSKVQEIVREKGYTYLHPYEDEDIIAGHGTLGIDILKQEHFDTIVIPMGGGGLAAGLSTAIKAIEPNCRIIGCEPSVIGKFSKSLEFGSIISSSPISSVANALLPLKPGTIPFPYIRDNITSVLAVDEKKIIEGEKLLINTGKILSEISSAIVIGSALQFPDHFRKNEKVCFVISGGNIEFEEIYNLYNKDNC